MLANSVLPTEFGIQLLLVETPMMMVKHHATVLQEQQSSRIWWHSEAKNKTALGTELVRTSNDQESEVYFRDLSKQPALKCQVNDLMVVSFHCQPLFASQKNKEVTAMLLWSCKKRQPGISGGGDVSSAERGLEEISRVHVVIASMRMSGCHNLRLIT